jgi:hypothetical protein
LYLPLVIALTGCWGYISPNEHSNNIDSDEDGYAFDVDCDDERITVHPDAVELVDNVDNDCNGEIDEGTSRADYDGDGFCEAETCVAGVDPGDCNDRDAAIFPGAVELLDGIDNDCNKLKDDQTEAFDDDGDGYCEAEICTVQRDQTQALPNDCNDADDTIHPSAQETCFDTVDSNCDLSDNDIDALQCTVFYADDDGDDVADPNNSVCQCEASTAYAAVDITEQDCDDTLATRSPRLIESVDGVDNDCNNIVDDNTDVYDDDMDGYCETAPCVEHDAGYLPDEGDCDDANDDAAPDLTEVCGDDVDNDCDDSVDEASEPDTVDCDTWYRDKDDDLYPDLDETNCACGADGHYTVSESDALATETDCDDNDDDISPEGAEGSTPDGDDNDCNNLIDDGTTAFDDDGDGYCETAPCVVDGGGLFPEEGDCDDDDKKRAPDLTEICDDGKDNDCDGKTDEAGQQNTIGCEDWHLDADGDDFPVDGESRCQCDANGDYTLDDATAQDADPDCNDDEATANPDGDEGTVADTFDNDCNGLVDDHTELFDDDGDGYCEDETGPCVEDALGDIPEAGDCDDEEEAISPDALEICGNDVDENCNDTAPSCALSGDIYAADADVELFGANSLGKALWTVGDLDSDSHETIAIASDVAGTTVFLLDGPVTAGELNSSKYDAAISGVGDADGVWAFDWNEDDDLDILVSGTTEGLFEGPLSGDYAWAAYDAEIASIDGFGPAFPFQLDDDAPHELYVGDPALDTQHFNSGVGFLLEAPIAQSLAWDIIDDELYITQLMGNQPNGYDSRVAIPLGDVTGDGRDNLAINIEVGGDVGWRDGEVGILALPVSSGDLDMQATMRMSLLGNESDAAFGRGLALGADIDGLGGNDLLVGAPLSNASLSNSNNGAVYGFATSIIGGTIDTSEAAAGFTVRGGSDDDELGHLLAGACDFNGDDVGDLVVGSQTVATNGTAAGAVYVFYGPMAGDYDATLDADLTFHGEAGDEAGPATCADLNGDGVDDLVVTLPSASAPKVLIFYGVSAN